MKRFTLVELIVVMAMIGLLLSLLLPSIEKSQRAGKAVVCKTKFADLYKANIAYQKENNHKLVNRYIRVSGVYYRWPSLMWDYYKSVELYQCPEDDPSRNIYPIFENPNQTSLMKVLTSKGNDDVPAGYNENIWNSKTSFIKFEEPSKTPMFGDSRYYRLRAPKGNITWYYPEERHLGGANFVLSDGHAETRNLTNALKYQWNPY